jgi:glutathione S-transferase
MSGLTLHYWGIRARNYAPIVIAQAGGLTLTQATSVDLPALKPTLPFGQLPYLTDDAVTVGQSGAVIRYLAHKGNLDGRDNLADFAMSEMLIEEMQDITSIYNKCQYPPTGKRSEAFDALFNAEDSPLIKQLAYLEALLTGDNFCSKPLAGDYGITTSLDVAVHLEPTVLANFPKLAAFYARMIAMPAFAGVKDYPMYFNRTD